MKNSWISSASHLKEYFLKMVLELVIATGVQVVPSQHLIELPRQEVSPRDKQVDAAAVVTDAAVVPVD